MKVMIQQQPGSGRHRSRRSACRCQAIDPPIGRMAARLTAARPASPTADIAYEWQYPAPHLADAGNHEHSTPGFCTIDEALDELRAGRMIVLVDDEYRENEGDLVMAAEHVTPAAVNFMIRHACGRLCVADLAGQRRSPRPRTPPRRQPRPDRHAVHPQLRRPPRRHHRHLGLRPLPHHPGLRRPRAPARKTSSATRATWTASIARPGGVLVRAGHTEGSVDLCRLAGLREVGVSSARC